MLTTSEFKRAEFSYQSSKGAEKVPVDFNPATLEYAITVNTQGEGGGAQQTASSSSAKLNFELIFDSTDTGDDVRGKTNKVERMLQTSPGEGPNPPPQVLSEVTFEWGAFKFVGVVDSFKQTMDFFSENGVPLRATVTLSMSQPKYKFDQAAGATKAKTDQPFVLPGGDPSTIAAEGGNPSAARGIAAANGLESLRAAASSGLSVGGGGVSIGAAAGFSAGASAGFGAGASASGGFGSGASASAGTGAGASFGVSGGASFGAGASAGFSADFGASSSAGVSAGAGAFGGLHASSSASSSASFKTEKLFAAASAPGVAPGALFDVTGRAIAQSSSTFKTNVGATSSVRFDETF